MTPRSGKVRTPESFGPYIPTGYQMIETVEIRNYRCFEHLRIEGAKRFNIVVGDAGSGKTTLLEAIFLALCSSVEVALRLRKLRGLDFPMSGTARAIEEALWADFFTGLDTKKLIQITLDGRGPERRALYIQRGARGKTTIPLGTGDKAPDEGTTQPFSFIWRDEHGTERTVEPKVTSRTAVVEETGEELPDFFFFGAGQQINPIEVAQRFSDLTALGRERQFVDVFKRAYDWIEDLAIEVKAGAPIVHAKVKGLARRLPINNASGAVNRLTNILLCIASRARSVVIVDEIEDGIFYKNQGAATSALISFVRKFDGQVVMSTHSHEWIEAFVEAAGKKVDDIALWRLERNASGGINIAQFSGSTLRAGIEQNVEIRARDDAAD